MFKMKVVLPHKEELELHHNMLSSCSQKVTTTTTTITPFCPFSVPVQENNKLASSELANYFPRCVPVLVRLGSRQSSSITPCHQVEGGRQKYPKQKEKDFSLFKETCCKNIFQGLEYLRDVNPAGTVPVLIHNGHPVYESHEQIVYIDQVKIEG